MNKLISLLVISILSFISFFSYVGANFEKEKYYVNNLVKNKTDNSYQYEERWAKWKTVKEFLELSADTIDNVMKSPFWYSETVQNYGNMVSKYFRKISDKYDHVTKITNDFITDLIVAWTFKKISRSQAQDIAEIIEFLFL